ncbi:MAG: DUF742 domain-containing protein [Streptosporangiaceae bacterium]|nr:DUF742 domain-containing protein [Streptosporangiaceae bacterium]MBV9855135.1 DUF742 domain-containing protein [Streptosporangiaceae bacterium]
MSGTGEYRDRPVRPYVLTGGRAVPTRNTIRPDTLVIAASPGMPLPVSAGRTERALLGMCRSLLSLAEAAAYLELPVSVVMVVASDLVDSGHLLVRTPGGAPVSREVLQELLHGLRKLA